MLIAYFWLELTTRLGYYLQIIVKQLNRLLQVLSPSVGSIIEWLGKFESAAFQGKSSIESVELENYTPYLRLSFKYAS